MNDRLIELAFKVRDCKLWETFSDSDIFAVRLSDGETAYCSIMGMAGEHYGIGVYVGRAGWNTYLNFLQMATQTSMMEVQLTMCTKVDCINCDFTPSRDVESSSQKKAVLRYAKEHGIRNPRTIGIPDFVRYSPYIFPGPLTEPKDEAYLEEALDAAVHLGNLLRERDSLSLGFSPYGLRISDKPGPEIPCFLRDKDGGFQLGRTMLPGRMPENLPQVVFNKPDIAGMIAMLPVRSNLECRFLALDIPVTPKGGQGYFPAMLFYVDGSTGIANFTEIQKFDSQTTPGSAVNDLSLRLLAAQARPSVIFVMDDLTEAMLKDFCSRTGIKLQRVSKLKHLEPAWAELSLTMRFMG